MQIVEYFRILNITVFVLMTALYFYQIVYMLIGLHHPVPAAASTPARMDRYAVMISARNEADVIGQLIDSLQRQNYPKDHYDIFVLADNCTDNTAEVARMHGACVYERFNHERVGKGYALDYLYHRIVSDHSHKAYNAFFVFDADNIVDPQFITEMNKVFTNGNYDAITCYRNSKNYAANWLSAAYSIWFLHEARFINYARSTLGKSCMISGTGFLVSAKVMEENGGWPYHLLTEDIQFSVDTALKGKMIGYCEKAMVYDEQPTSWKQSWQQRLRWSKGFYQIDVHYLGALLRGCFSKENSRFSCYDILMTIAPSLFLSLGILILDIFFLIQMSGQPFYLRWLMQCQIIHDVRFAFLSSYFGLLLIGTLTVLSEWDKINAPMHKRFIYLFLFPLFIFSYIPIGIQALFCKVHWTPIRHYALENETVLERK